MTTFASWGWFFDRRPQPHDARVARSNPKETADMLVKIMRRGDRVLSIEKNRIVVLRKSGEAEVFTISRDRVDGFPKLVRELKVTFGHDEIELDEPGRGRSKGRVKIMTAG